MVLESVYQGNFAFMESPDHVSRFIPALWAIKISFFLSRVHAPRRTSQPASKPAALSHYYSQYLYFFNNMRKQRNFLLSLYAREYETKPWEPEKYRISEPKLLYQSSWLLPQSQANICTRIISVCVRSQNIFTPCISYVQQLSVLRSNPKKFSGTITMKWPA